MAYTSFTKALMQAKRASSLRGTPFSAADVYNLHSGYMEDAGERTAAERVGDLGERSLSAQEKNWTDTLVQEKLLSDRSLNQTRELADLSRRQTEELTGRQIDASDRAASKALTGNVVSTGVGLGGAYLILKPAAPVVNEEAAAILKAMNAEGGAEGISGPTGGGSTSAGYGMGGATLAIGAAGKLRQSADREKPYEDTSATDKWKRAPATGVAPALLDKAGLNTSNQISKIVAAPVGVEETAVGKPLDHAVEGTEAALSGDFEKTKDAWAHSAGDFVEGTVDTPGKAVTAVKEVLFNSCIVYGHLYGKSSRQVRTAMIFCSQMDEAALLGYYSIGKKAIGLWERFPILKRVTVRSFVTPFYRYMQWKVGHKENAPIWSRFISPILLMVYRAYYHAGLPIYRPEGYEKCIRAAEQKTLHEDLRGRDIGDPVIP